MSFDLADFKYCKEVGLNPFGTGQCLSTVTVLDSVEPTGLNPFGTGQCLSTDTDLAYWNMRDVSIPLEQGNVFRLQHSPQPLQ